MKWINKGHEYDKEGNQLSEIFEKKQRFMIFGAGVLGKELASLLSVTGCLSGFIDNDIKKQGKQFCGYKIISVEEHNKEIKDSLIVIAADAKNVPSIRQQLEKLGLRENRDFFVWDYFRQHTFPILYAYYFNKSYVDTAQISLTERCTLKCKKCAHGCYAVKNNSRDLTIQQAKKSADMFFMKVDCVKEFHLIGGEPLLYCQLDEIITYIGERYRSKIIHFCITTNGTIVPNESILSKCKKYGVEFKISNYSKQIPRIKENQNRLVQALKEYNIEYELYKPDFSWMDYGFEYVRRQESENELINVFDKCRTPCREIRENKYYYCVMARSVSENLGYNIGKNDYLDLEKVSNDDYAKVMLEFSMGFSEKGYLDMCARCNGRDAYQFEIPAAEQL